MALPVKKNYKIFRIELEIDQDISGFVYGQNSRWIRIDFQIDPVLFPDGSGYVSRATPIFVQCDLVWYIVVWVDQNLKTICYCKIYIILVDNLYLLTCFIFPSVLLSANS